MTGLAIRAATLDDEKFVMALQRANRESVGGLPWPAIRDRVERGTLALAMLNGEPCGYLMFDYRDGVIRLPQACIQYDARRRTYGEALWNWVVMQCPTVTEARLRCAADIDANLFWQSMGFTCVGVVMGGVRRGRYINLWQRWFTESLFTVESFATQPVAQLRQDCLDAETGFLQSTPEGFAALGAMPLLAWSNRKSGAA